MEYFSAKIEELVKEVPGTKKSFIQTFVAQPPEELILVKGTLFGLVEINSSKQKMLELIDVIIEEVQENYYGFSNKETDKNDIETIFEAVLQKTNITIAAFLENAQISIDLSTINIVIGVLLNKRLYLTQVGNLNLFLFQRLTKGGYRIINILEVSKTPLSVPNPLKIFSQVISGGIGSRDVVALMTPGLLDYFSLERLKNILTAKDGIAELKASLQELKIDDGAGVILLQIEKRTVEEANLIINNEFNYQKAAVKDSMRGLEKTEQETAKLLTPSVFPEIKKYASVFKKVLGTYLAKIKVTSAKTTKKINIIPKLKKVQPKLEQVKPKIGHYQFKGQQLIDLSKNTIQRLNFGPVFKTLNSKFYILIQKIPKTKFLEKIYQLPTSSKIFLAISIILGILFFQSVIWNAINSRRTQEIEKFSQIILNAETKKNEAEASLIYRDENKARELLIEVSATLADLDPPTKSQKEQITLLQKQIEENLQTLRHIINIEEPILVANFQNIDNQAQIAPVMVQLGPTIYTQNQTNGVIYKVNTQTRVIASAYSLDVETGGFTLGVAVSPNEIIFINQNKKVYALTPSSDQLTEILFAIDNQAQIADLTLYGDRVYLLDKTTNQIYRYQKISNGYGNAQTWVKDSRADFSQAISLVIDGSVYVLYSNGAIQKFQNGSLMDFNSLIIDPAFISPTKIKTTIESKYLYILDPPTKRLVVLDKEGRLINQYTAKEFDNLKDFIVVEAEKKIYLLNGNSIFGIRATHLE